MILYKIIFLLLFRKHVTIISLLLPSSIVYSTRLHCHVILMLSYCCLDGLVVFVGWLIVLITILIQCINILGEPSRNIGCLLDGYIIRKPRFDFHRFPHMVLTWPPRQNGICTIILQTDFHMCALTDDSVLSWLIVVFTSFYNVSPE